MGKKVYLITGASGFIGSALVKSLQAQEETQCLCVNRTNGYDLSQPGWSASLPDIRVDVVFHLAQSNQYRHFPDGGEDMARVNILSTLELLEWSRTHGVKKFFLASTGTVYSSDAGHGGFISEEAPCEPASMYGSTKLCAELMAKNYKQYFSVIIGRIFTVYGPGQKGMLISNMIQKVVNQERITLVQNKGIYLTPLFIDDCIQILLKLTQQSCAKHDMLTLNIAGCERLSLMQIVECIGKELQFSLKIETVEGDVASVCADISVLKTRYLDGFTPFQKGVGLSIADRGNGSGD